MSKQTDLAGKPDFQDLIILIDTAKKNALQKINEELIRLYYNTGKYLCDMALTSRFGDGLIDEIATLIAAKYPEIKGFNRRGHYRMKSFYDTYRDDTFVTPLVTQITWTNHLLILSKAKTVEERHFYIQLCINGHYSKRELERQLESSYYERYMLSKEKLSPIPIQGTIKDQFLDTYVLEFLDMPRQYSELDLKKSIIQNLRDFLLEIGKDFTFMGEEYRIQVGKDDFYIDLLFYHRELSCLVAFELKIGKFKPEYLGKMNFYLEALDREYTKKNENPSVGVILCASKDDEVVEFALSRNLSPTLVSDYTLKLPTKEVLQHKLHELTEISAAMPPVLPFNP